MMNHCCWFETSIITTNLMRDELGRWFTQVWRSQKPEIWNTHPTRKGYNGKSSHIWTIQTTLNEKEEWSYILKKMHRWLLSVVHHKHLIYIIDESSINLSHPDDEPPLLVQNVDHNNKPNARWIWKMIYTSMKIIAT